MQNDKKQDHIQVGRIKDAHNLKGEVFVTLASKKADWLDAFKAEGRVYLIKPNNGSLDYELERVRPHKNGLIIKPKEITNRTDAEALKGYELFIPEKLLVSLQGEAPYLNEVLNFKLEVLDRGEVGFIKEFSTNGLQDLAVIQTDQGLFEVPFIKEFIVEINENEKRVTMDLPVGLLGEETGDKK